MGPSNEYSEYRHGPAGEARAAPLQRLSRISPRVNAVRALEDLDFVVGNTENDFASRKTGFEVFRFEGDRAVEHWDNIQERQGTNPSGRTMVDGPTEAVNLELTERNRSFVQEFVQQVLIEGRVDRLTDFVDEDSYAEHNPRLGDGVAALLVALEAKDESGRLIDYRRIHRILAEGSFVLCVSEGRYRGVHSAFYDLFRIENGKVAEHWDTTEKIAPRSEWKNDNGKF